ncbi:nitroreductase family protein [Neorhizobium alkalisoli]|uniref:nitroreductase family protein n=1 Tax=Neorhizobium alkalisoli TaxID=528178 RepID=UPI000CFA3B5E|nr:nitroreductase family protein [Neorhizobium alkalisoli]
MNIVEKVKRSLWFLTQFLQDGWRYFRHCSISPFADRERSLYYKMIIETHSLEKGLSVGRTRPGFGRQKIRYILDALRRYDLAYSELPAQMALGTLETYVEFHKQVGFSDPLVGEVERFVQGYRDKVHSQGGLRHFAEGMTLGREKKGSDFLTSRFSSRIFDPSPLSNEEVATVVSVAQTAPSQCNRQATRAYFFRDKDKIRELLALQAGAGGFSDDVSNLFVIASELPAWGGAQQRNQPYIDGALFCMNLLLACHAHELVSCPLNLAITHKTEDKIKAAGGIGKGEVLIMMIAVGRMPANTALKAARSPRRSVSEILTIQG